MSAVTLLSDRSVEALAIIHDHINHDMELEGALFHLQAELAGKTLIIRNMETTLIKLEHSVIEKAERLIAQNMQIKQMEQDIARVQIQLESAQTQLAYERQRSILSRLLGTFHAK